MVEIQPDGTITTDASRVDWSQVQSPLDRQKFEAIERQNSVRQKLRDRFRIVRDPVSGRPVRLVYSPRED